MHKEFLSVYLKIIKHMEDLDVDGDNIEIDLKEIGDTVLYWIYLRQDGQK
jgi:hypothetical protein